MSYQEVNQKLREQDMEALLSFEILLHSLRGSIVLEGDYWIAFLRLLEKYGYRIDDFLPPGRGTYRHVSRANSAFLTLFLKRALEDILEEDRWIHYETENGCINPLLIPPRDYFRGAGVTYLVELADFIDSEVFFISLMAAGTGESFLDGPFVTPCQALESGYPIQPELA